MVKLYYLLTKPGILLGNLITTAAGFALGSQGHFDFSLFFLTIGGLGLVIGSACVFNNYFDRKADAMMERTKDRPLARGTISGQKAILFATLIGILGFAILGLYVNVLTAFFAFIGFFVYVALYTFWKYRSPYAIAVGSLAGATPPVVGYCAASNQFDLGAVLLFTILALWQMPHFFSIAIYRMQDYRAAAIPVLPIKNGMLNTKKQMLGYLIGFIAAICLLTVFGFTGYAYLAVANLVGFSWLCLCVSGFKKRDDHLWARQMFVSSIVVMVTVSLMIILDKY